MELKRQDQVVDPYQPMEQPTIRWQHIIVCQSKEKKGKLNLHTSKSTYTGFLPIETRNLSRSRVLSANDLQ